MTNEQIRIAVAIQLGCKMYDSHSCSRCNSDAPSDSSHGLHYRRAARHHSRHSHLNNLVQRALVSARVPSVLKPLGFTRNDAKRSDGITLVPWSKGFSLVWHATVVDPLAPIHRTKSSGATGATTNSAAARKYADIEARVTSLSPRFWDSRPAKHFCW